MGEVELRQRPGLMGNPSARGRFGEFGGGYVPESLVPACEEVERAFRVAWADPSFHAELDRVLSVYAGRPTALTPSTRLSAELGVTLLLKREDLMHTGSHKINNALGALQGGVLKPLVFAFTISLVGCFYGLRTTGGTQDVGRSTTQAVVAATVIGKLAGTALPARKGGFSWPGALSLGVMMQTKGLMEVVVLAVLHDAGLIGAQIFSAMVAMAVVQPR